MKAVLSLGSNLGNKSDNLKQAIEYLKEIKDIKIEKISSFYNTAAWGKTNQDDFLNCGMILETDLKPLELLDSMLETETRMGRVRTEKWGPRNIDIDLIFYDNLVYETERLKVPHPYMQERDFVLICLNEICPDFVHPVLKKSVAELYKNLNR